VLNQTDATVTGPATDAAGDSTMRLLAEGVSLSLLWDLVDPDGPASEELLRYEN
jgi:hypothetical protein